MPPLLGGRMPASDAPPPKPSVLLLNPGGVCDELREIDAYVGWKNVLRQNSNGAHWSKIPVNLLTGGLAKTDDPSTWTDFETAVKNYRDLGCDGIGICRTQDLVFGELDGVLDSGGNVQPYPWAIRFLAVYRGRAYIDTSPSRAGLHAICRGTLPAGRRQFDAPGQIHTGFAFYDKPRYFTLTGDVRPESGPIHDLTDDLKKLHAELFPKRRAANGSTFRGTPTISLSDTELLDKARRAANGAAFVRLFDHGDWQGFYPSESEADLALCSYLAFWTQGDPGRIDALFRQSALCDEKWEERADYRELTIGLAVSTITSFYDPDHNHTGNTSRAHQSGRAASCPDNSDGDTSAESSSPSSAPPPSAPPPVVSPVRSRSSGLPQIQVQPPYRSLVPRALDALHDRNEDLPQMFVRGGHASEVVADETGKYSIRPLTIDSMIRHLDAAANFVVFQEDHLKRIFPPMILAKQILSSPPADLGFPPLAGIVRAPVLRKDGSVLLDPGYDRQTQLYCALDPGLKGLEIPPDLTIDDVDGAKALLCDHLLGDFCFADPAEAYLANTLAVLLTFFLKLVIDGALPIVLIDAVIRGSGKSLLAMIPGLIALGDPPPLTTAPEPRESGEWRKRITGFLLEGAEIVVIDNAVFALESAEMCAVVTSPTFSDRLLGTNTTVTMKSNCLWVFTGNALNPRGDIVRRCHWIRLDPKRSDPERRADFRHPDLMSWASQHRADIIRSLLILGRWWVLKGCPLSKVAPLGNFTRWAQVVGGVLECAEIQGFLTASETYLDPEIEEWMVFLATVDEVTYQIPFTVRELIAITEQLTLDPNGHNVRTSNNEKLRSAMPEKLSESLDRKEFPTVLGIAFRERKGRYYGDDGIHLHAGSERRHGAVVWEIRRK
jgi:hypothetical protein